MSAAATDLPADDATLPPPLAAVDEIVLSVEEPPAVSRNYRCQCGRPVFFDNSRCLACETALGYVAAAHRVLPLAEVDGGWQVHAKASGVARRLRALRFQRCANFDGPSGCNWMVGLAAEGSAEAPWCESCRLNHTIPDLAFEDNGELWGRIEIAKRRLVSTLLAIGLPVLSKVDQDPQRGVMFDFLRGASGDAPVLTGHDDGLITLNIEEADDARREQLRHAMHEPYRTLLGHLRHEIGHYYWDRLVADTEQLADYRTLFGDETVDYGESLQRHYDNGPPPDWAEHYVSAYATMHPWEDWAETWAHYLHMIDTLDTALSFGLSAANVELQMEPFGSDALYWPDADDAPLFLAFVNDWAKLTGVLNEMSRSMGQPDFYPFVLPRTVIGKLQYIHRVVQNAAQPTV